MRVVARSFRLTATWMRTLVWATWGEISPGTLRVLSLVLTQGTLELQFDGGGLQFDGVYEDSFKLRSFQIEALLA